MSIPFIMCKSHCRHHGFTHNTHTPTLQTETSPSLHHRPLHTHTHTLILISLKETMHSGCMHINTHQQNLIFVNKAPSFYDSKLSVPLLKIITLQQDCRNYKKMGALHPWYKGGFFNKFQISKRESDMTNSITVVFTTNILNTTSKSWYKITQVHHMDQSF